MIPTPTEITYFLEVYQTKHVSKAAMRLGITQPTLTQALQKLEEKLKTTLFHRTKQGVVPTTSATVFYSRANSLKECWSDIQDGVFNSDTEIEGSFVVGCHQSVGAYTAPRLLKNLEKEAPKLHVKFVHDFSRKITEKVVSYEVDMGYVVNPAKHPDLVFKKLGDDRVTFWKKKGAENLPKRIFADGSRAQTEDLLGKTMKKHFGDWKIVESTSLELIRTLTSQGLGVGVLPERVAHAESKDLVIFDKSLPSRPDEIYLAYRKEVLSSNAGRELLRLATFPL
ncbi:MAG: LysR family transcriptional regulator [Bdellovibrionales bacterium]|nr:LysR family transcriptional regulator [Bdellovibrionales bacterium]